MSAKATSLIPAPLLAASMEESPTETNPRTLITQASPLLSNSMELLTEPEIVSFQEEKIMPEETPLCVLAHDIKRVDVNKIRASFYHIYDKLLN